MNETGSVQTDRESAIGRRYNTLLSLAGRLLSICFPLVIMGFLLAQISPQAVWKLLSNISYAWIVLGVGIYLVTNIFRAWRTQVLLPDLPIPFTSLFSVMLAQSMFNNTLPGRAGELSFIYLLRKHENIAFDKATVALLISRIADYIAVAILFIIAALLSLRKLPPYALNVVGLVLGVLLLTVIGLLSATWLGKGSLTLSRRLISRIGLSQQPWIRFALTKGEEIIVAFEAVHTVKRYLYVLAWSTVIWIFTFGWFYAFLRGVEIDTAATNVIVGSTFAVLSKAIPFISIGGIGAHEAGWTVGYLLIGFDKSTAILSGFAVNLLTLLTSVILGPIGLLILRRQDNSNSHSTTVAPDPGDQPISLINPKSLK